MSQDNPQGTRNNPFKPSDETEAMNAIVQQASAVRQLTKQEMLQTLSPAALATMVERIGSKMWVVLDSTGRSVAYDPALRQPFHHNNKKFAETVAKEIGGTAVTWSEALRILSERNKPND